MAIMRRRGGLTGQYQSLYPSAHNGTYVKATTKYDTNFWPYFATDPAKTLTGNASGNSWSTPAKTITNQRFHIDIGAKKVISLIYYENYHTSGIDTNAGAKNFILQGSNSASSFAELTYATNTGWVQIATGQFTKHAAADAPDPKYILIPPHQAYRYFAIKMADNWGNADYMSLRRIVLQEMY